MSLSSRYLRFCLNRPKFGVHGRFQQTQPSLSASGNVEPVFQNVQRYRDRIALRDDVGKYSYANLFLGAKELAGAISQQVDGKTNQNVMFLCPNDADYVITLWAIWMSGQIAVPLSPLHPKNILLYYANDTNASLFITTSQYADLMQRVAKNTNARLHVLEAKSKWKISNNKSSSDLSLEPLLPSTFYNSANALILYTSGTTGNPKGVVLSHKNLVFQTKVLLEAWHWSQNDTILHTLPLHHVHGIVNALLCPLHIGGKVIMLPKFDSKTAWSHLLGINTQPNDGKISVYMAVPTIYRKLIDEYENVFSNDSKMVEYIKTHLKTKVRLMVSGSAPLPVPIFNKWLEISGHRLLERYGMTETGMCLSNLYDGDREPGYVGLPLPGVSARLEEENTVVLNCTNNNGQISYQYDEKSASGETHTGELLVKSEGVFKEYFNRPEATAKEFTEDGWFRTGDIASYSINKNKFKILGRKSADIIKSGGYKISAVQVETVLLEHPNIRDCAVVGIEDEEWGQKVAAVIVLKEGSLEVEELRTWGVEKMAKYNLPTVVKVVEVIPKNAMGKVNKKELVKSLFVEGK